MSVADTLSDAVSELDEYLSPKGDPTGGYYNEPRDRAKIIRVRNDMERTRCVLDGDPELKSYRVDPDHPEYENDENEGTDDD